MSSNISISKLYYLHVLAWIPLISIKMHSSAFSLIFLLGILPNPIVASTHGRVEAVPIYSTLDQPFTLQSLSPEGAHVVVNGDGTPVATFDKRLSTQFKLTNGSLTTLKDGLSAVYGPIHLPLPPRLIPIVFRKGAPPHQVPFVAETDYDYGGKKLVLTALKERKFKKRNVPAKNWS